MISDSTVVDRRDRRETRASVGGTWNSPENDRAHAVERARHAQVLEQAVDPIGLLADLLEEQHRVPQVGHVPRAEEMARAP